MAKKPIRDEQGKIIWKNLFYIDIQSLVFLIIVIFLLLAYKHDTKICQDVMKNPVKFCETYKCEGTSPIDQIIANDVVLNLTPVT